MSNERAGAIPDVTIVGQTVPGQLDEQLIMFTTPYLNPDVTYQAVIDAAVIDIPFGGSDWVLWCIRNNRGEFDGSILLRVVDITQGEVLR